MPENPLHDRRRLLWLALTLAILLGAVGAYDCYWDPYGRFRSRPAQMVFGPSTNYLLLVMNEVNRVPAARRRSAEVILTGDSRAYQLTTARTARAGGREVLNLGVPGASFEESLSILTLEAPRLTGARCLVVAAPLERFTERFLPDRCRETWPVAESVLRYALNWQTCQDAGRMARFLQRGVRTGHVFTGSNADLQEADRNLSNYWREMFHAYEPDRVQARLKLLRETLAPWQARGTKVIFWAPPLRQSLHALIPEAGLEEVWAAIGAELQSMGPLVDLKYAEGLPGVPFTFKDPVHVAEGGAILERLLEEDQK